MNLFQGNKTSKILISLSKRIFSKAYCYKLVSIIQYFFISTSNHYKGFQKFKTNIIYDYGKIIKEYIKLLFFSFYNIQIY